MSANNNFRCNLSLIIVVLFTAICSASQNVSFDPGWIDQIAGKHDMTLSSWGPYTKRYIGLSHIPDSEKGLRFDLSVFPGYYRGKASVPNVMFESDFHPWEASPDLLYFSFRHELEWKDRVYADISYSKIDENSRLVRVEFVNKTELPQSLVLHMLGCMNFPPVREYAPNDPIFPGEVTLPNGSIWVDGLDYKNVEFSHKDARYNLVYDGKLRGEVRANGFVNAAALGSGFAENVGDEVSYGFDISGDMSDAHLLFRYKMNGSTRIHFSGFIDQDITCISNSNLKVQDIAVGSLSAGSHELKLTALGGNAIEIDGFAIVEAKDVSNVHFNTHEWDYRPEIVKTDNSNSIMLKYNDTSNYYGLVWDADQFQIREFYCKDIDLLFARTVHNHVSNKFEGEGEGHFTNIFIRPVEVAPESKKILYAKIITGTREEVELKLNNDNLNPDICEKIYSNARKKLPELSPVFSGEKYEFSQSRMAATLLTNVVYPVYTQHSYIKHYAPGRWWDCLYTWDSGFIGLGLADVDIQRALECLNAYVTEPGDQSVFIHHGSMVPVQHYLFQEIWNKTQSREFLEYYYPRLKQYYEFFVGRLGSSTMDKFKSGLLSSFDYFYNSGGWDDYPAQKETHRLRQGGRMAPVVNSAQAIRIAKIMSMAADELGINEDITVYQTDIAKLTDSLQKYSWDQDSGYFGYVRHDSEGNPTGILKFDGNVNFNMGLDGLYPLVAGIGTDQQIVTMLERLKSPERIWSKTGLSAVDQSAPYYSNEGYWNGTVWMPHQWFFWKSLLDLGEGDFAWDVAKRALDVWRTEVDNTYNCKEHFVIETGRGAGWHQFGALSSPVMKWYSAYFKPGTLTAGFDVWVKEKSFYADNSHLQATLKLHGQSKSTSIIVCMNPKFEYRVQWNGTSIDSTKTLFPGVITIDILNNLHSGVLSISVK